MKQKCVATGQELLTHQHAVSLQDKCGASTSRCSNGASEHIYPIITHNTHMKSPSVCYSELVYGVTANRFFP